NLQAARGIDATKIRLVRKSESHPPRRQVAVERAFVTELELGQPKVEISLGGLHGQYPLVPSGRCGGEVGHNIRRTPPLLGPDNYHAIFTSAITQLNRVGHFARVD